MSRFYCQPIDSFLISREQKNLNEEELWQCILVLECRRSKAIATTLANHNRKTVKLANQSKCSTEYLLFPLISWGCVHLNLLCKRRSEFEYFMFRCAFYLQIHQSGFCQRYVISNKFTELDWYLRNFYDMNLRKKCKSTHNGCLFDLLCCFFDISRI